MTAARPWTEADRRCLRECYATQPAQAIAQALGRTLRAVYAEAHKLGLRKPLETIAEMARQRTSDPRHGSRASRFGAGLPPWNKGVKGSTGHHPNTRAQHFKPGNVNHNRLPLGALRINGDGMLERKVTELRGGPHLRWHPVHRLVWEAAHGPVPDGHIVVFRPGKKTTDIERITPDVLELVTRAEHMRRNSFRAHLPAELHNLVQLRGALQRQINRKAKEAANHE